MKTMKYLALAVGVALLAYDLARAG